MESDMNTFAIYLVGIIVGGIATIVTLVFSILSLIQTKQRNAIVWGVSFFISLIILVLSIIKMVDGLVSEVKDISGKVSSNVSSLFDLASKIDEEDKKQMLQWVDSLKKYTREEMLIAAPVEFYDSLKIMYNQKGLLVAPFVYPYQLNFNISDCELADLNYSKLDSVVLENIKTFSIDENFIIAQTDNSNRPDLLKKGMSKVEYVLFDMRTNQYLSFSTEQELIATADKIGFVGSLKLQPIKTKYSAWLKKIKFEE